MSVGVIALIAVSILVYLGLAQRSLDRLRMSDRAALLFLIAIIIGGFLPDIPLGGDVAINLGGGLLPIILVGYLFSKAQQHEIQRTVLAVIIATGVVFLFLRLMPAEPTHNYLVDPLYIAAIVAGISGYLAGRSRRGAFIAGTLAIVLNDIITQLEMAAAGVAPNIVIGGAGALDAVVIAGILALGLAEFIGETAEKISLSGIGQKKAEKADAQDPDTGLFSDLEHVETKHDQHPKTEPELEPENETNNNSTGE